LVQIEVRAVRPDVLQFGEPPGLGVTHHPRIEMVEQDEAADPVHRSGRA
jgi:hypothetical protein